MMEVPLSRAKALPFNFESAVSTYILELEAHRYKTEEAAPVAPHPLVEAAVKRVQYPVEAEKPDDFVPNYAIIDDTPPPPSLEDRKGMLAHEAAEMAHAAMAVVTPPRKANLWNYQVSDAMNVKEGERTHTQRSVIAAHEARNDRNKAIYRHLAQLQSDIEDLTEDSIGDWKPAPFPT